jgi:hypothetical protein
MPVEELESHYKGMRVPLPDSNGYTEIVLFVEIGENMPDVSPGRGIAMIKRQRFPEWVGVEKMVLSFLDGRLADYTILYTAGDPDWRSSEEFAASVTSSFGIPLKMWKKWGAYAMYLECTGFRVAAKVENYSGHTTLRYSILTCRAGSSVRCESYCRVASFYPQCARAEQDEAASDNKHSKYDLCLNLKRIRELYRD